MKKALITGITGQDGSYLAELLLGKGYEVHGVVRRSSSLSRNRLDHLYRNPDVYNRRLFLHYCDLEDVTNLRRILMKVAPDEIYHLAGQSHVRLSFEIPESTCQSSGMGVLHLLEIIRDMPSPARFYHAGSSEVFGSPEVSPQHEATPMNPVTPYGCAKAFACHLVRVYREGYGLFVCNGILYNHESPRRGENFVSRKIVKSAVETQILA
jgi:GDPmannose 4,6-dehydratase